MRAVVPNAIVDNEYNAFPKGNYDGTVAGAVVRDINGDGSWVQIKLSLKDVTPREGTGDPGRKGYSGDILLVNTDKQGNRIDVREAEINGDTPFPVERAAGLLAGFGLAVGAAERTPQGTVVDLSAVAEALAGGTFEGQRVGFSVDHWTKKGEDTPRDQLVRIGPASN